MQRVTGFLDGDRVTPGTEGCRCGPACEFPCWQRVGLTDDPCCPDCTPLPCYESDCSFCKGRPVGNAATWVDGKPRPPAACPRCGETNT